jgi:phosphate acetyltransferase
MELIQNRPFDELKVGDNASLCRTLGERDIMLFAVMSGDVNPAHVDQEFAKSDMFHKVIAHGMWSGMLISTVMGTLLPGPGTIYLGQSLRFLRPVGVGDTLTVSVEVTELRRKNHRVCLDCRVVNQDGELVVTGVGEVIAPTEKISRPRIELPEVDFHERRGAP